MKLKALLKSIIDLHKSNKRIPDIEITSIHYHAQDVKKGGLFVAIPGLVVDAHDYIDEAVKRGAVAVISQKPINSDTIGIRVNNSRKALAAVSGQFFGNPSEKLCVIGITGTNGKTTTAYLVENILLAAGFTVGVIGTINRRYKGKIIESKITTPESLDLQRILKEMLHAGVTHVVMEVSSHAIDLCRVENCSFDVGVFTNLTRDHLDYHKNMELYWDCKKSFFKENLTFSSKKDKTVAVVNSDNKWGKDLLKSITIPFISVGYSQNDMVKPKSYSLDSSGVWGQIDCLGNTFDFKSSLVGEHNLENILCAVGVGKAIKLPEYAIKKGIKRDLVVPGRLEKVSNDNGRSVFIDYAHTPDALEKVLLSLKPLTKRRIICVFGCGGDRDISKRPQMGEIACRFSNLAIITSDNPRTEPPEQIIEQILTGVNKSELHLYKAGELKRGFQEHGYVVEADRKKAIKLGIGAANVDDIILIAGKGHENYQIVGDKRAPFDDKNVAYNALIDIKGSKIAYG